MAGPRIPTAADLGKPEPAERLAGPFKRFAARSSAGGVVLIACTVVALVWANSSAAEGYRNLFHGEKLTLGFGDIVFAETLGHWINDALMALFFFVVGLEIKREVLVGELSSPRRAALPIAGAVGGMIGPAIVYAAINWGQPTVRGWGIPMATDIAFALGILSLLGAKAPTSLKVFLTSLAIADDLGALIVIAAFYTEQLATDALICAGVVTLGMIGLNLLRVRSPWIYFLFGVALWYFVFRSGVHATISGVIGAMTIPATARAAPRRYLAATREALDSFEAYVDDPGHEIETSPQQRAAVWAVQKSGLQVLPVLHRLEDALHPFTVFLVIPVFALANAGVHLGGPLGDMLAGRVTLGVVLGLFVGKPVGIFLAAWLAVKLGIGELPRGVGWRHIFGAGCLGGIGFTMALFIANLAFDGSPDELDRAKLGILGASLLSALLGLAVVASCKPGGPGDETDATG
ncbi:MAG TPA: Na+/H+ antiporter NhaA [Phycisphaerales bacterium]|nr:Na+/H+ antiporter NhaA [Phycisphaerales bacterium]